MIMIWNSWPYFLKMKIRGISNRSDIDWQMQLFRLWSWTTFKKFVIDRVTLGNANAVLYTERNVLYEMFYMNNCKILFTGTKTIDRYTINQINNYYDDINLIDFVEFTKWANNLTQSCMMFIDLL